MFVHLDPVFLYGELLVKVVKLLLLSLDLLQVLRHNHLLLHRRLFLQTHQINITTLHIVPVIQPPHNNLSYNHLTTTCHTQPFSPALPCSYRNLPDKQKNHLTTTSHKETTLYNHII